MQGTRDVAVEQVLDPRITAARDAIVRVTMSAICGTDLHPYRGEIDGFPVGTVLGHEFVGVVEDVGPGVVGAVAPGDRVVASDIVACGGCEPCGRGWHYQCVDASLFGYADIVGAPVSGGQAERVRVPFADVVLGHVPEVVPDERAIFAADVLPTALAAIDRAGLSPGAEVGVVGAGPVGLCCALLAAVRGAGRVLALDVDPGRLRMASALGAEGLSADGDAVERVLDRTEGRGCDVVIEAVGSEAALRLALDVLAARGTVAVVGAHGSDDVTVPARTMFAKETTVRFAVGNPIVDRERVMRLLEREAIDPSRLITHRLPLERAAEAYRLFDARRALKVVLLPA